MSLTPEELGEKIKEAQGRRKTDSSGPAPASASGRSKALRAATDLVTAIFVGGILGFWLDKWLDTRPLLMILMIFAGFGAGFVNLYRSQMGNGGKE